MRVRAETTVEDCDEAMLRSRLATMEYRKQIKRLRYTDASKFICKMRGVHCFNRTPTMTIVGQIQQKSSSDYVSVNYLILPVYDHYLFFLVAIICAISALKAVHPVLFLGGSLVLIFLDFIDYLQQREHCQMKFDKYIHEAV